MHQVKVLSPPYVNHPLSFIHVAWFLERSSLSWVSLIRGCPLWNFTFGFWIKIAIVTWQWTHQPRPWRLEPNNSPWKTSVAWHGTDKFNTSSPQLSPRDASSGISAKTTQSSKSVTLAHGIPGISSPAYFIADWEHWLGDWEHLEPMMQQLHSFHLFCCYGDRSVRTTFKPS